MTLIGRSFSLFAFVISAALLISCSATGRYVAANAPQAERIKSAIRNGQFDVLEVKIDLTSGHTALFFNGEQLGEGKMSPYMDEYSWRKGVAHGPNLSLEFELLPEAWQAATKKEASTLRIALFPYAKDLSDRQLSSERKGVFSLRHFDEPIIMDRMGGVQSTDSGLGGQLYEDETDDGPDRRPQLIGRM